MDLIVLALFSGLLIGSIILNISILWALGAGYILFFLYSLIKGYSARDILKMSWEGIFTVHNILITFILIGTLTGLWRSAGTIPAIVCYAQKIISPAVFILITFWLNCLVSFLTGTSFGTAATMGAVCMTMALSLRMNPVVIGGAILSGVYFGDRCSPVSTSALLVAEITRTDIYRNIQSMFKTAWVPFIITSAIYLIIGLKTSLSPGEFAGEMLDVQGLFETEFSLGVWPLFPAIVMLILSICRISVKKTMTASILMAIVICIWFQQNGIGEIANTIIWGYSAKNEMLSRMINGGGILSMIRVGAIVCLSSSYVGMFKQTGLLNGIQRSIMKYASRLEPFSIILPISAFAGAMACNQTLTIMLTHQLCSCLIKNKERFAIDLENSAVIVAPLIPWSIAGGVPLASVGAPTEAIVFAFYLYLVPLWHWWKSICRKYF